MSQELVGLLPCPFCGGAAASEKLHDVVSCQNEECTGYVNFHTRAAWNTRQALASNPTLESELAETKEAFNQARGVLKTALSDLGTLMDRCVAAEQALASNPQPVSQEVLEALEHCEAWLDNTPKVVLRNAKLETVCTALRKYIKGAGQ